MDQSSQLWASINRSKDRGLGWLKTTSRFLPRTKKKAIKNSPLTRRIGPLDLLLSIVYIVPVPITNVAYPIILDHILICIQEC